MYCPGLAAVIMTVIPCLFICILLMMLLNAFLCPTRCVPVLVSSVGQPQCHTASNTAMLGGSHLVAAMSCIRQNIKAIQLHVKANCVRNNEDNPELRTAWVQDSCSTLHRERCNCRSMLSTVLAKFHSIQTHQQTTTWPACLAYRAIWC